jgi:RNA polymerase sigma-70 factor (ECF subfamily)
MKVNWQDTEHVRKVVEACIKGDRMNQQVLYKAFFGKMLVVCMRYTRNKEEAQDILQEGFVKVFQKLMNYGHKGSLEGWIRRIMVNTAIDFIRKRKDFFISSETENEVDLIKDNSFEDEEIEQVTLLKTEIVINFIQKLSPAYKAVFNMYIMENMTHAEIAEQLNINIGTSKSNLAKAKIKLKEMVLSYIKTHEHETF